MVSEKTNYNFGLAALRVLMCFEVILIHTWNVETVPIYLLPLYYLKPYAVPTFMFMSFFLTEKSISSNSQSYLKNRAFKLFIPQIFWALIYFLVYFTVQKIKNVSNDVGVSDLLWQIFTGHSPRLNAAMWFQTDLIIITILFYVIYKIFKSEKGIFIVSILAIVCLLLQYSGFSYNIFNDLRFEIKFPFGRLFEMIPIAAFGCLASKFSLLTLNKKSKTINLLISLIFFTASLYADKTFLSVSSGFGYEGAGKLLASYFLTMFAYNLGLVIKQPPMVLKKLTNYTLGIYCSHRLVNNIFNGYFLSMFDTSNNILYCIFVYVACYIVSWMIYKIPCKWTKYLI